MLFLKVFPEVREFIESIHHEVKSMPGEKSSMSKKAINFMSFCLTALIVTGALNWDKFERSSCGSWKAKALSKMMRYCSKIPWNYLLIASSRYLIKIFDLKQCHLVFDDFDRERSKRTKKIYGAHKARNKKGGGFISAQTIVLLVLVTPIITIPVGFSFYRPDPKQKAWRKEDERLRKDRIPKKYRPKQPDLDPDYPNKKKIAAKLLRQFKYYFPDIKVRSISGDSIYLSAQMKAEVARIYPHTQFISQLRRNQTIMLSKNRKCRVDKYFAGKKPIVYDFKLRGHLVKRIYFQSARLYVKAHNKVSHVIAYRYENEEKYRFICASELTWRAKDIIRAFAFRWLVEVVIEDLKQFDGWGKDASQYGEEGASRGLCLSLLLDQFLVQHPKQRHLHKMGKSLHTTGSLRNQLQFESLITTMESIIESDDPKARLREIASSIDQLVTLRPSTKHMAGRDFEPLEPSPSLLAKFGKVA